MLETGGDQIVVIADFKGLTKFPKALQKMTCEILTKHYPEMINIIIFVNTPEFIFDEIKIPLGMHKVAMTSDNKAGQYLNAPIDELP